MTPSRPVAKLVSVSMLLLSGPSEEQLSSPYPDNLLERCIEPARVTPW